jgi:hypothetical protein
MRRKLPADALDRSDTHTQRWGDLAQSRPILPLERGLEGSFGFVRMELGRNPSDRGNLSDRHVLDHSADATNALA